MTILECSQCDEQFKSYNGIAICDNCDEPSEEINIYEFFESMNE